jgi:hypothetical protein
MDGIAEIELGAEVRLDLTIEASREVTLAIGFPCTAIPSSRNFDCVHVGSTTKRPLAK